MNSLQTLPDSNNMERLLVDLLLHEVKKNNFFKDFDLNVQSVQALPRYYTVYNNVIMFQYAIHNFFHFVFILLLLNITISVPL